MVDSTEACVDISGSWDFQESGMFTETSTLLGETFVDTYSFDGQGSVTINQTECTFSYEPLLSGLDLEPFTPEQLRSLTRTGTITGSNFTFQGIFLVFVLEPGVTITSVEENRVTGTGTLSDGELLMEGMGTYSASGTILDEEDVLQAFTAGLTGTSSVTGRRSGQAAIVSSQSVCADASCSMASSTDSPTDQKKMQSLLQRIKQRFLGLR